MEENLRKSNIPVAIDTNLFVYLNKLANPIYDPDGEIMRQLDTGYLSPYTYNGRKKKDLPPLLQDGYLGMIEKFQSESGKNYFLYSRLMDVYTMYKNIKNGTIKPYLLPSVFKEVKNFFENCPLKDKFTVVTVPDEQYQEFKSKRNALANEYVRRGAMKGRWIAFEDKVIPDNDAVIMAEASIVGLVFVTTNVADFRDNKFNSTNGDYTRSGRIQEINSDLGYLFRDNTNQMLPVIPYSPSNYINRLKHHLRGITEKKRTVYFDNEFLFSD